MTDNLTLWKTVETTPTKHTKAITGKSYNGTSPKPHYLVWKATETFGPCGIGWGFTIEDERVEDGAGGERLHVARVKVWYKWGNERGEVEHIGGTAFSGTRASGKPYTDEDAPKKSVTDALIKALSMIGFAGDIFMGRYDDSKYISELKAEERAEEQSATPAKAPAPARQQAPKQQPAGDAPPVKAAYVIARGGKIGDWMDRLTALVAGAPDAAAIKDIEDANKPALNDMQAKAPAQHQRAMQILSRATTDAINRSEAA